MPSFSTSGEGGLERGVSPIRSPDLKRALGFGQGGVYNAEAIEARSQLGDANGW